LEPRDLMSVTSILSTAAVYNVGLYAYWPPQPTAAGQALINGLSDPTIRSVALTDYNRDGQITRNDMMDILKQGSAQYTFITATQYRDLLTLVNNGTTVAMPGYVQNLASKVLESGPAFSYYASGLMSYSWYNPAYAAYDSLAAYYLGQGVNNWFLGLNRPDASYVSNGMTITPTYQQVTNVPLFANGGPRYQDVSQGALGDCWLMASLAEVAARNPAMIQSMFIDNGDGTWTVRFYNNGSPDYVTVDNYLPSGGYLYDHPQGDLWAALAEKAYAQENASGWIGSGNQGVNSYQALNGGWPVWALPAITGKAASSFTITAYVQWNSWPYGITLATTASNIGTAWSQGQFVVLCTSTPSSSQVVPYHCYAMVGLSNGQYTLYNPWGVNGGYSGDNGQYYPGYFTGNVWDITYNFTSWGQAGAAAVSVDPQKTVLQALPKGDAQAGGAQGNGMQPKAFVNLEVLPAALQAMAELQGAADAALVSALRATQDQGSAKPLAFGDTALSELFANLDVPAKV
jgi:hypothetical protein